MKEQIKQIYLDADLIRHAVLRAVAFKDYEPTQMFSFLLKHPEIERSISLFTVSEIVANILRNPQHIRSYEQNKKSILDAIAALQEMYSINIIEYDKDDRNKKMKGFWVSSDIIDLSGLLLSAKDALHVCIAMRNDLTLVSNEPNFRKAAEIYPNITTDDHFYKQFEN